MACNLCCNFHKNNEGDRESFTLRDVILCTIVIRPWGGFVSLCDLNLYIVFSKKHERWGEIFGIRDAIDRKRYLLVNTQK